MTPPRGYPADQAVDVALRDGSSVHIRPVRPEDRDAIRRFLGGMSAESLYLRSFGIPNVDWLSNWSVDVDYADRYGIVATSGPGEDTLAHAAYVRIDEHRAEVAFEVADRLHGQGLGTLMLAHLAGVAAQHGIQELRAVVMPSNHKMLDVFSSSGFPAEVVYEDGVTNVTIPTTISERTLEAFDRRQRTAAVSAVKSFLCPSSVALIGASRRPGTVGHQLLTNMLEAGFSGPVYPVNRHAREVLGQRTYRSVEEIGRPVELAVIAAPAAGVLEAARECAAAGVRALVVVSAGFAESEPAGAERQRELLRVCREAGMRLAGPNCIGVANLDPAVRLNATFATGRMAPGRIGFLTQSGGVGIALTDAISSLHLGLSSFVSVGNKPDISGNDLLDYWETDPATDMILLYLESFGNPRRFARVARRVATTKPILAVKSGSSAAGARATTSHTGTLLAASDVTVDALFRQAGVIRADTISELLHTAGLLAKQPAPAGGRVVVATNGGGPGVLCADACEAAGLTVPELSPPLQRRLRELLAPEAATANPVDMIATATAAEFGRALELLASSGECDAVIALAVPALSTTSAEVAAEVDEVAARCTGVTIVGVYMDDRQLPPPTREQPGAARFRFPEDAVTALAAAAGWSAWRKRPRGTLPALGGCDQPRATALIATAMASGADRLAPAQVGELLACYGLPTVSEHVAGTAAEAVVAAERLGFPVALKAIAPTLVHKSEVGGVRTGLQNGAEVAEAAAEIGAATARAGHGLTGWLVQRSVAAGVELLLGVVHDPSFGPVVACGAGGTDAELLQDVSVRITPLTDRDAAEMLRSLRIFPLLDGYRGRPRCDVSAVADALLRLSALVDAHPQIYEVDINPLIAGPAGISIVDARIRLEPPLPSPPVGALRAGAGTRASTMRADGDAAPDRQ